MESLTAGDSPLAEIPPDALLLISGPPMTGKYSLMLQILAAYADGIIVISTRNQASRVTDDYRAIGGDVPDDRLGIIDCVSRHQSVGEATDTDRIKYTGSPENLTRIGVKFTELFELLFENADGSHTGVGIHSLSQLLMHTDIKKVYQFLQVLTGQIRSARWLGVAVVDDSVADTQQLQTLHHHFDGVIQTRENEAGERELRVRGLSPAASPWTRF